MRKGLLFLTMALLSGCVAPEDPGPPVIDVDASMEYLKPGLRPEVLLFPEYLLMEDFELHQHGRIPESNLVGGGMKTDLSLSAVRGRFNDVLSDNNWVSEKMEIGRQSFRLIATHGQEWVEIRAVQGTGPTQVFLLYKTESVALSDDF